MLPAAVESFNKEKSAVAPKGGVAWPGKFCPSCPLAVPNSLATCDDDSWSDCPGASGESAPASAVWLLNDAESLLAILADRMGWNLVICCAIVFSYSLRNFVIRAWLQTSGCLITTVPWLLRQFWMWSILRATSSRVGGSDIHDRTYSRTPCAVAEGGMEPTATTTKDATTYHALKTVISHPFVLLQPPLGPAET